MLNLALTPTPPRRLLWTSKAIYTLPRLATPTTGVFALINLFILGKCLDILLLTGEISVVLPKQDLILVIVLVVRFMRVVVVVPLLIWVLLIVTLHRDPVVPLAVVTVPQSVLVLLCPRVDTIFPLNKPRMCAHDPRVTLNLVPVPRYTLHVLVTLRVWVFPTVPVPRVLVV